ncbi:hypothetical protein GCM10023187_53380 [Nibrella viscosa]|uniref:DUF4263 domain-containing protein n=1 Tax=Nibrella viscosa TaxID=1084524 RepID=A0ABP8L0F8_9BACT
MFSSIFNKKKKSSGIFIPKGQAFKELTEALEDTSINGISEHLGYNTNQVQAYYGYPPENPDITAVIFEVFTQNIVFVSTKTHVTQLTRSKVDYFLRDFKLEEFYNSVTTEDILQEGIENRTLSIDYLARVLAIESPDENGVFFVPKIGHYLYFNEGFLTDFSASDGLNKWAKQLMQINPNLIDSYEKVAKKYWGHESKKIINEVNIQAEAFADLPQAANNKFIPLHEAELGTINFFMLLVCHYDRGITLPEFKEINHGRYKETLQSTDSLIEYKLGNFTYRFLASGVLFDIKRN